MGIIVVPQALLSVPRLLALVYVSISSVLPPLTARTFPPQFPSHASAPRPPIRASDFLQLPTRLFVGDRVATFLWDRRLVT